MSVYLWIWMKGWWIGQADSLSASWNFGLNSFPFPADGTVFHGLELFHF